MTKSTGHMDKSALEKEVKEIVMKTISPYTKRIVENIERVMGLLKIYIHMKDIEEKYTNDPTDILRAAVVLLHASLEDFMRALSASVLPYTDSDILSSIPLVGINPHGRPEKFGVGELSKHRGKGVEELIKESVESHLERVTFNNTEDIVSMLRKIGIDAKRINKHFKDMDLMIKRRHQIVHRADRVDICSEEGGIIDSIGPDAVMKWAYTVMEFMADTLAIYGIDKNINDIKKLLRKGSLASLLNAAPLLYP